MNIREFSELTGLSPYTLRYYEKIGLLASVPRNASGHRQYSPMHGEWARFIVRLKKTGMPLAQIIDYAALREQGDETASQRKQLLEHHAAMLEKRIAHDLEHLAALKDKIAYYTQQLK